MKTPETTFMEKMSQVTDFMLLCSTLSSGTFSFGNWNHSSLLAESMNYLFYWQYPAWSQDTAGESEAVRFVIAEQSCCAHRSVVATSAERWMKQCRVLTVPTSWEPEPEFPSQQPQAAPQLQGEVPPIPREAFPAEASPASPHPTGQGSQLGGDWQEPDLERVPRWLRCHHVRRTTGVNSKSCRKVRKWLPTPVFLPGESHGQRSPAGHSPRGRRVRHAWAQHRKQRLKHHRF